MLLCAAALERLRAHLELQSLERQFEPSWQDQDKVFASRFGSPIEPRNLDRRIKSDLAKAGLPDFRFHDLRHTAATLMLKEGVHPKVVQERLGHSSITMTLDTYSHVLPDMQSEAADKMDDLLRTIPFPTSDRVGYEANSKLK